MEADAGPAASTCALPDAHPGRSKDLLVVRPLDLGYCASVRWLRSIPVSKPRIVERLENWGRYWRDHHGQFDGHCRSIEHRYVPGKDEAALLDAEGRQERVAIPPDVLDAHAVNDAWKRCTKRAKSVLKWSYAMGPVKWQLVATRSGITVDEAALETASAKAQREIAWLLDEGELRRHGARNSSSGAALRTPVSSETERPRRGLPTPKETEDID